MKFNLIFLTQKKVAFVDVEDFKWLNQFNWYFTTGYAYRRKYLGGGKKNELAKYISMHRLIMGEPEGMDVDHINGNTLDNRRSNLRIATRSQNNVNTGLRLDNRSGRKGVYWVERAKKYQVCMTIEGKSTHLGYYGDIEEAASIYNAKAKELYGEFVRAV